MKIRTAIPGLLAAILWAGFPASPVAAQELEEARRQAEQLLGRPLSDQEILRLLQQSGLTPDQVRRRLAAEGLPPDAAEPWLAVLEGRADRVPPGVDPLPLIEVLTGARLAEVAVRDTSAFGPLPPPAGALATDTVLLPPPGPPIFGQELFRRATSQFEPVTTGPVPPDYRIAPRDEIVLVLTGDVELAYRLTVSREGWIVIPDVGRVPVLGRTMAELEAMLRRRLSQVYSGLTGDAEATTFLDVSLGALRTNQVFVVGEVERPGAYGLSSLATALTALYWAGGPNRAGSFREVVVNRGGRTVARIDLYEYLLRGRAEEDVRLEHGDIVFVPVATRRVQVDGAVVRPGIYELRSEDDLRDVLRFAGGPLPTATLERVQVERVLGPEEPVEGPRRVLLDVPLGTLEREQSRPIALRDGDRITVFAVLEEMRNQVQVSGGVWRPGVYGAEPGLRLWDLIERAGGLLPDVLEARAQIQRLSPDQTRQMIQVSLERDGSGRPVENPQIEPRDQVFVFARRNLREEATVTVGGWVRAPGEYPFVEGMTVRDLILRAGGLRTGGSVERAEIARLSIGPTPGDTITRYVTVPLDSTLVFDVGAQGGGAPGGGSPPGGTVAGDVPLRPMDAVYVRRLPGFEPQRTVTISGEVLFPGPYSLATRDARLLDLVAQAGGLTPRAYAGGLELWRAQPVGLPDPGRELELAIALGDTARARALRERAAVDTSLAAPPALGAAAFGGQLEAPPRQGAEPVAAEPAPGGGAGGGAPRAVAPAGVPRRDTTLLLPRAGALPAADSAAVSRRRVGLDFTLARRDAGSPHNVLLQAGDSIHVPSFVPTVTVRGRVAAPGPVLYREGAGLGYYVEQAGGYMQDADPKRTWVEYADGRRATRGGKFLFFGGGTPDPDPGSMIYVPIRQRPEAGVDVIRLVTLLTSVATAAATIIIVSRR